MLVHLALRAGRVADSEDAHGGVFEDHLVVGRVDLHGILSECGCGREYDERERGQQCARLHSELLRIQVAGGKEGGSMPRSSWNVNSHRGASPLGLPYTLARAPLRRRAPIA